MHYGRTKRVKIEGAWERIPQFDWPFARTETGENGLLIMLLRLNQIAGLNFSKSDEAALSKQFKPWIIQLGLKSGPEIARCIPFDKFLNWKEKQPVDGSQDSPAIE